MQVVFDGGVIFLPRAHGINIFESQQELAAVLPRQIVCRDGGQRVAEVQATGRAGGETRAIHRCGCWLADFRTIRRARQDLRKFPLARRRNSYKQPAVPKHP